MQKYCLTRYICYNQFNFASREIIRLTLYLYLAMVLQFFNCKKKNSIIYFQIFAYKLCIIDYSNQNNYTSFISATILNIPLNVR